MKLQDKVALITGAGSGLGRVSAILFASEGASIGVADINLESAEETANEISRAGGRALALQVDVSNGVSVESMVQQTVESFGILDVLYNNAGTAGKVDFLASMPEDVFDRVLAVNLRIRAPLHGQNRRSLSDQPVVRGWPRRNSWICCLLCVESGRDRPH